MCDRASLQPSMEAGILIEFLVGAWMDFPVKCA